MKINEEHITGESTIVKFLNGDLSETGKEDFNRWLDEDPENRKTFEEVKKIWDHSENIKDFQVIDANNDWLKIKNRINFRPGRSTGTTSLKISMIWFRRIAAVLILLLGIGFLAKQFLFTSPNIIAVSTGDFKDDILLPDGSRVFLNKYSQLTYPEKFHRKSRQVDLTGEGYFEVTPDPDKLFRINIDDQAIVEVLGTSFNLRSDKEKGIVDVRVVSGIVAFFTPQAEFSKTILIKDEEATLQNDTICKDSLTDKNFLSWKTGILVFEDEKIENVFNELSSFYNKKFIINDIDYRDIRFTSRFDNQELESVLEEIKLVLNLEYTLAGDSIIFINAR
jgi:transmembrane sensor